MGITCVTIVISSVSLPSSCNSVCKGISEFVTEDHVCVCVYVCVCVPVEEGLCIWMHLRVSMGNDEGC